MRLYKCMDCGCVFEPEEAKLTDMIYGQKDLRGNKYVICPVCESDDLDYGNPCEWCRSQIGEHWLGTFLACDKCYQLIMAACSKTVNDFADKHGMEYRTAKEWFIGWVEEVTK